MAAIINYTAYNGVRAAKRFYGSSFRFFASHLQKSKHPCQFRPFASASPNIKLRRATKDEMKIVSDFTISVDWNMSENLIKVMRQCAGNGIYVAEKANEIVGTLLVNIITDNLAFIGISITKEGHENQGIQQMMLKKYLPYAGERNIGSVAGSRQLARRYSQVFGCTHIDSEVKVMKGKIDHSSVNGVNEHSPKEFDILPVDAIPFDSLVKYDEQICNFERPHFLKLWCKNYSVLAFAAVKRDEMRNSTIVGYTVAWPMHKGFNIMPLYADSAIVAKCLLDHVLRILPHGTTISLYSPSPNIAAVEISKSYNLMEKYTYVRQYTKEIIPLQIGKVFSACDPSIMPI
ncbi:holothin acyltransferase-like [Glandiceps talaboti]